MCVYIRIHYIYIHVYVYVCVYHIDPYGVSFMLSFSIMWIKITADFVGKIRKANNINTYYLMLCTNSQQALMSCAL